MSSMLGLVLWIVPASEAPGWTLAISSGTAYNIPLKLSIEQEGGADLRMIARYETAPFRGSPYCAARLAWTSREGAWELELIHHKLYLNNTTPEVPRLEATHGYNYVLISRSGRRAALQWRVGLGPAIVHLEGTAHGQSIQVRGGILGSGYRLTGPAVQFGVGRPVDLSRHFFLSPEVKLTGAYAWIPIEGGHVTIPNLALHALVGIGYAF